MEDISGEDILQIFATEEDTFFPENSADSNQNPKDTVMLKFLSKGSKTLPKISDISDLMIQQLKFNVCGISFKGDNSVLFEISRSTGLFTWLVKLFEERHVNQKLSEESKRNIINICIGKFNIVINGTLFFLVVIPNTSTITFPCQNSFQPYGLCNSEIINIMAGSLNGEASVIIQNFINNLNSNSYPELKSIYGIRLEWNEQTDTHSIRFLLKSAKLTNNFLKILNDFYGNVSFSPDTIHVIPSLLRVGVEKSIEGGKSYLDVWKPVYTNDILISDSNEVSIVSKAKNGRSIISNPVNSNVLNRNATSIRQPYNSTPRSSSLTSRASNAIPRPSISGIPTSILNNFERMNLEMGFKPLPRRNSLLMNGNRIGGSIKPKIKSVIGCVRSLKK